MASPRKIRQEIIETITTKVGQGAEIEVNKLVSALSIETGFNSNTINKIIEDLKGAEIINIESAGLLEPSFLIKGPSFRVIEARDLKTK